MKIEEEKKEDPFENMDLLYEVSNQKGRFILKHIQRFLKFPLESINKWISTGILNEHQTNYPTWWIYILSFGMCEMHFELHEVNFELREVKFM